MHRPSVIIDADVIVNWLIQETETFSLKGLWQAPLSIITDIESERLEGFICLTTLMEIHFLLMRKFKYTPNKTIESIQQLQEIFEIITPNRDNLVTGFDLQLNSYLDPYDAILLATKELLPNSILITRDKKFLNLASIKTSAMTPEEFLKSF